MRALRHRSLLPLRSSLKELSDQDAALVFRLASDLGPDDLVHLVRHEEGEFSATNRRCQKTATDVNVDLSATAGASLDDALNPLE